MSEQQTTTITKEESEQLTRMADDLRITAEACGLPPDAVFENLCLDAQGLRNQAIEAGFDQGWTNGVEAGRQEALRLMGRYVELHRG